MKKYSLIQNMERLKKTYDEQYIKIPDWMKEVGNIGESIGQSKRDQAKRLFDSRGKIDPKNMKTIIGNQNLDVLEMLTESRRELSRDDLKSILSFENDFARGHNSRRTDKANSFFKHIAGRVSRDHRDLAEEIADSGTDSQLRNLLNHSGQEITGPALMSIIDKDRFKEMSSRTFDVALNKMDFGHKREAIRRDLSDDQSVRLVHSVGKGYGRDDDDQKKELYNTLFDLGRHDAIATAMEGTYRGLSPETITQAITAGHEHGHEDLMVQGFKKTENLDDLRYYLDNLQDTGPKVLSAASRQLSELGVDTIYGPEVDEDGTRHVKDGFKDLVNSFVDLGTRNPEEVNKGLHRTLNSSYGNSEAIYTSLTPELMSRVAGLSGEKSHENVAQYSQNPDDISKVINEHKTMRAMNNALQNPASTPEMKTSFYNTARPLADEKFKEPDLWRSGREGSEVLEPFVNMANDVPESVVNHIYDNYMNNEEFRGRDQLLRHKKLSHANIHNAIDTVSENSGLGKAVAGNASLADDHVAKLAKYKDKEVREVLYSNKNLSPAAAALGLKDRAPSNKKIALAHPNLPADVLHKFIMTPGKSKSEKGQAVERDLRLTAIKNQNTPHETLSALASAPGLREDVIGALASHPNSTDDIRDTLLNINPSGALLSVALDHASTPEKVHDLASKWADKPDHDFRGWNSEDTFILKKIMNSPLTSEDTKRSLVSKGLEPNSDLGTALVTSHSDKLPPDTIKPLFMNSLSRAGSARGLDNGIGKLSRLLEDHHGIELTDAEKQDIVMHYHNSGKNDAFKSDYAPAGLFDEALSRVNNFKDLGELTDSGVKNPEVTRKFLDKAKEMPITPGSSAPVRFYDDLIQNRDIGSEDIKHIYDRLGGVHGNGEDLSHGHLRDLGDFHENLLNNPSTGDDIVEDLYNNSTNNGVKREAGKKIAVISPNKYNEGLENAHSVEIHPAVEKLKHLKGLIEEAGGSIHKSKLQENKHGGAPGQILDHKGEATGAGIDKFIGTLPKTKYNISYAEWGGMQRHDNTKKQKVVQVNLTDDHVKQMKDEGVFDVFKEIHEKSRYSGHPVDYHSLGWARVDDSQPGHWHIDEVQSDFGQNTARQLSQARDNPNMSDAQKEKASKLENGMKTIMKIIKGPFKTINHAIIGAVHQTARDNGTVKSTSMDMINDQARQSGMTVSDKRPLPGHMKSTYEQIPNQMNYAPEDKTKVMPDHQSSETEVNYRKLTKSLSLVKYLLTKMD